MRSPIKLGGLFQTRIRIHYSWMLAIILISFNVTTQFSTESSLWLRIALGVAASVLFFLAVLLRELLLLLVAVYKGVAVESITIFPFGGLLQVNQEDAAPSRELLLAIAGMLCNLLIASMFYLAYALQGKTEQVVIVVLVKWLAFLYFTLSLFHIIPGFPLEGGRILHSILWKAFDDIRRATRIASWTGWTIGFLLAVGGILILVFTVERFTGAFLVVLGLILQNAATHSRRQQNQVIIPAPVDTG